MSRRSQATSRVEPPLEAGQADAHGPRMHERGETHVPASVERVLSSPGEPIGSSERALMSSHVAHDFSRVRVHRDEAAAESADRINALAYSSPGHIVFGEGQYAPATRHGRELLLHEAAHIGQQEKAITTRAGIAPTESAPEVAADELARNIDRKRAGFTISQGQGSVTPWQIHRQPKIAKRGTVARDEPVGAAAGVPVGNVEVRTGEDVELAPGRVIPNVLAIEYSGALSADSRWLQFVWFEMLVMTPPFPDPNPRHVSATIPTTSGTKPFTTNPSSPNWTVDSASTANPFYEAGGVNIRNASSTTIFDAPGGSSATPIADAAFRASPGATWIIFTAHFNTYLVQNDIARFVVRWQASTSFTKDSAGNTRAHAIGYTVHDATDVGGLPSGLRAILHSAYSSHTHIR